MNEERKLYAEVLRRGRSVIGKYKTTKMSIVDLMLIVSMLTVLVVFLFFPRQACASVDSHSSNHRHLSAGRGTLNDRDCILAVIGEAENQGYKGQLLVSSAIRNRGTLKGVYGLHAPRVKNHLYSQATYDQCRKAWLASAGKDYAMGATNWENVHAFGEPYWAKSMTIVMEYKDHRFFK